ncbi:hypothetical protein [Labilibaculum euxinus]
MENLETQGTEIKNELLLETQAEVYLRETAKWAKFLAIVGFIFMGFMVLGSFVVFALAGSMASILPFPIGGIGFLYLVLAGVYFFPIYYLLQFANKAKLALAGKSTQSLTESMKYMKSHYKFMGIFTIVMLALYPIGMIVAIIVAASQGF